jgi:small GTP-binding protein
MNGAVETSGPRQRLLDVLAKLRDGFQQLEMPTELRRTEELNALLSAERSATVVVVGEFNTGKSTLLNALCGINLLPVGIVPITATVNIVSYGQNAHILIIRRDGTEKEVDFSSEALQEYTAKHGDQSEIREVHIQTPYAPQGLTFVDTPGLNEVNQTRAEIVYEMIPKADALLFVLNVVMALKRSEIEFLRKRVLGTSLVKTMFVLNHIDKARSPAEVAIVASVRKRDLKAIYEEVAEDFERAGSAGLAQQVREYGKQVPVFRVSAKKMNTSGASPMTEGDPDGLREELLRFAEPDVRDQAILQGVQAQTQFLVRRFRESLDERSRIMSSERESLVKSADMQRNALCGALRDVRDIANTLENSRSELVHAVQERIPRIFLEQAETIEQRMMEIGAERTLQIIQEEIPRKLEAEISILNDRMHALAVKCAAPSSRISSPEPPRIDANGKTEGTGESLSDAKNQPGHEFLAMIVAMWHPMLGILIAAFPFISNIFRSGLSVHADIADVREQLRKAGQECAQSVEAKIEQQIETMRRVVLDRMDAPQQSLRNICNALMGASDLEHETVSKMQAEVKRLEEQPLT